MSPDDQVHLQAVIEGAYPQARFTDVAGDTILQSHDGTDRTVQFKRIAPHSPVAIERYILHAAAVHRLEGGLDRPFLVLSVPKITSTSKLERIKDLMGLVHLTIDWCVIDDNGRWYAKAPSLNWESDDIGETDSSIFREKSGPFQKLNFDGPLGALLKALFLTRPNIDRRWWPEPNQRPKSVSELARIAGIPQSTCYRLLAQLQQRHWVDDYQGGRVRLLNPHRIMEQWLASTLETPAQPSFALTTIYGEALPEPMNQMLDWLAATPGDKGYWAIGGWGAIACNNLAFVSNITVKPLTIYCSQKNKNLLLEDLDCVAVKRANNRPQLLLQIAPKLPSVSTTASDLRIVDAIQSALDVAGDHDRGREQAEHIMERVATLYEAAP